MDWEFLTTKLVEGNVVPVIGNGLSLVKDERGGLIPLNSYLAMRIKEASNNPPDTDLTLGELALEYRDVDKHIALMERIKSIYLDIDDEQFDLEALKKLAEIPYFNFFVTTTPDNLLDEALIKARHLTIDRLNVINFSPLEASSLPLDLMKSEKEKQGNKKEEPVTVFNLLGSFQHWQDPALNDEEMLEYFFSLSKDIKKHAQVNYFRKHIKDKILLFIGCDFPDWFMRFIIRLITDKRYEGHPTRDFIVCDGTGDHKNLFRFLNRFEKNTYPPPDDRYGNVRIFIDELHDRLKIFEKKPVTYEGTVFLSYNKEDVNEARLLKQLLRKNGILAWLDEEDLGAGKHKNKIKKAIRDCKVFVPLISNHSLSHPRGYMWTVEWAFFEPIIKLQKGCRDADYLMLPIILNDTDFEDERIPGDMKECTMRYYPRDKDLIVKNIQSFLKEKTSR